MHKNCCLVILLIAGLGMAAVEILSSLKGYEASGSSQLIWGFGFIILTILWATEDSKNTEFVKPFEFGFLLYVLWPISFPWYLFSTRGVDGLMHFLGFNFLFFAPWLSGLVAYVYFT